MQIRAIGADIITLWLDYAATTEEERVQDSITRDAILTTLKQPNDSVFQAILKNGSHVPASNSDERDSIMNSANGTGHYYWTKK